MRYLLSVFGGMLLGAVAGALLGFLLDQVTGQAGWSLVLGSLGACSGAFWAGLRRAEGKVIGPLRPKADNLAVETSERSD